MCSGPQCQYLLPSLGQYELTKMDSSDSEPVRSALRAQKHHICQQEEQLSQMRQEIVGVSDCQQHLFSIDSEQIVNSATFGPTNFTSLDSLYYHYVNCE